jgi:hypothetical protein
MIYAINPIFMSNIGSRRTGFAGEPIVPGAPQTPADECSITPLTRPHAPTNLTKRSTKQSTTTEETVLMNRLTPRASIISPSTTRSAIAADPAGPQATRQSTELIAPADATCADKPTAISVILPTTATDSERARAFWAKRTNAKTPAAASAGPQAAEPPSITKSRAVRTMETSQRCTTSPITVIHDSKQRADTFKGKIKNVVKDGDCLFSATELGEKKRVRELVNVWLQANPDHPFHTSTLAEYVAYESGEAWQEYCARMQCEGEWGGAPELVAIAQVWQRCIRVFENSGDELFHLQAVFGAGVEQTFIDIVYNKVDHYDTLVEVCLLNPIAHGAEQLRALGKLETHELSKTVEIKVERKVPEPPAKPTAERKARKELVERQVLDDLAERKELKEFEEYKARERHAAHQKFAERKGEGKVPDHLTVPKAEPEAKDLGARKQPKHYESRKVRAAREMREGLLAYRAHRALEERAACKAREELARANEVTKVQLERQARATSKEREAQKAPEATACRRGQGALDAPAEDEPRGSHQPQDRTPSSRFLTVLSGMVPPRAGRDGRSPLAR